MKIIFLDFDGVMNSCQSVEHWRWKYAKGDRGSSVPEEVDEMIKSFDRKNMWVDPMALSNLAYVLERHPETRLVISSTWRQGREVAWFNDMFEHFGLLRNKICSYCDGEGFKYTNSTFLEKNHCTRCDGKGYEIHPAPRDIVIDKTPVFHGKQRGDEIRFWLEANKHLPIEKFVILDDDGDMCEYVGTHNFLLVDNAVGFDWNDVMVVDKLFGGFNLKHEDLQLGLGYKMYSKPRSVTYYLENDGSMYYYNEQLEKQPGVYFNKKHDVFAIA